MSKQAGQCLCGAMSYEITEEPVLSAVCHCTHCQKATGAAFSINVGIPSDGFKIAGDTLKTYVDQGDSGKDLRRYFCGQCGSPLYSEADAMPGLAIVKVGTLDDTSSFKPGMNIFCENRMDWLKQDIEMVDFEKMPTS